MNESMAARVDGCPSDLELEQLLAGETPVAGRFSAHTATCPHCAERLAWMRGAGSEFTARVFPRTREAVVARVSGRRRAWLWIPIPVAACAAAAAVALFGVRRPASDYVGVKGLGHPSVGLEVYVGDHGKGRRVFNGDTVHPGDGLRFVVPAAGQRVFLFTLDTTGRVSRIYPAAGAQPVMADGLMPGGAILDDVVGPERVFVVYAEGALTFDDVERVVQQVVSSQGADAVRRLERLPLEAPQESVLLEKVPR